jgi:cell wall-associated NlpC family hydrolase
MSTFGLFFILAGVLLARQVVVGRTKETPSDIRDLALAFMNADTEAMKTVLTARGTNVDAASVGEVATDDAAAFTPPIGPTLPGNGAVAKKAIQLGNAASGYRLGATGPTFYDCSGLIWQAARQVGAYTGNRFTTSSWNAIAPTWCTKQSIPAVGDIVVWPTHHMGVYIGTDQMYSARSPSKGIGTSTISGDSEYFGSAPDYWRVNA